MERSITNTKVERKNDSFLGLLERMKSLNSKLEKEGEFEPHHRSPLAKTKYVYKYYFGIEGTYPRLLYSRNNYIYERLLFISSIFHNILPTY